MNATTTQTTKLSFIYQVPKLLLEYLSNWAKSLSSPEGALFHLRPLDLAWGSVQEVELESEGIHETRRLFGFSPVCATIEVLANSGDQAVMDLLDWEDAR